MTCLVSPFAAGTVGMDRAGEPFFWLDNRSKRIREPARAKGEEEQWNKKGETKPALYKLIDRLFT